MSNWVPYPSISAPLSHHCQIDDAVPTKTLRDAETIAINTAIEYERGHCAEVKDVSNPNLKKGFDLQSRYPTGEVRYIEVKGRTGIASVELTANERAASRQSPRPLLASMLSIIATLSHSYTDVATHLVI